MILIKNVGKSYRHNPVLEEISFTIDDGQCIGLMGKSGAGKSTLGKIIAGIEVPTKGNIQYITSKEDATQKVLLTQVVFQDAAGSVNPDFTVHEVLEEALYFAKKQEKKGRQRKKTLPSSSEINSFFRDYLDTVGLTVTTLDRMALSLSGGELQRLCLARALMMEPDLLILDEALSGLDPLVQKEILKLLGKIRREQKLTMLCIVHNLVAAYYLCDALYIMRDGKIVWHTESVASYTYERLEKEIGPYIG